MPDGPTPVSYTHLVKTILQQHKEEINVTSEDGVTTFTFSLRVE